MAQHVDVPYIPYIYRDLDSDHRVGSAVIVYRHVPVIFCITSATLCTLQ